jgi:nucleoid-associated protein YgaU
MDLDFLKDVGEALKDAGGPEGFEQALIQKIKDLGLDVDDLDIEWDGGTATVQGMAADQETLEKTLLAVGNTKGVIKVTDEMVVGLTDAEKQAMREAAAKRTAEHKQQAEIAEGRDEIKKQMEAARRRSAYREQLAAYKKMKESRTTFYTVEKGDSLRKIAGEQYGDESKWPEIFEANQPMIKKADLIYPGQVLRIPAS